MKENYQNEVMEKVGEYLVTRVSSEDYAELSKLLKTECENRADIRRIIDHVYYLGRIHGRKAGY